MNYDLDLLPGREQEVLGRLTQEGDALEELVTAQQDWTIDTPAQGWTVAHQIAHLADADAMLALALRQPDQFRAQSGSPRDADAVAAEGASQPRDRLLDSWRTGRALARELMTREVSQEFPWYGSTVNVTLMARLRLMETWAHGQDVYSALGMKHPVTDAVEFVADLGFAGRGLTYAALGLLVPDAPVRVTLRGPQGQTWGWGPPSAPEKITGDATEFCLVVTRRSTVAQTALKISGDAAQEWLDNARVFL